MHRAWSFVLTFLVVSAGFAALAPVAESASVTPEPTKLDQPMVGASSVQVNGRAYVLGGRFADGGYSDKIFAIDPLTLQVEVVRDLPATIVGGAQGPAGRYSGTAAAVGNKIYYFGGAQLVEQDVNGDGAKEQVPKASRDIIEFDPAANTARIVRDVLPAGAWGMSSAVANGAIYLFGGFTFDLTDLPATGRHDWVLRFDPSAAEGQRLRELSTKLPYKVQDAAAALVGRRIILMGGLSDHHNDTNPCPTYQYYDPETRQEDTRQITVCLTKRIVTFDPTPGAEFVVGVAGELPYRAQFISAAVVDDKAYVSGALLSDGTPSASIVEVALDRLGTPQARVITPTLPRGTFGQAVSTDGQTILIAGGRQGTERELTADIVRLDPRATPPWAPRSATAAEISGGVRISWEPPTYNGDSAVTGYRIYRAAAGGAEVLLKETTALSFDDTTVVPGAEYTWRVVGVNAVGEGTLSARVSRSAGTTTPGPVTSFQAFAGNQNVILRWQAPNQTGGSNLSGYRVMRNDQLLASLPPDATEYSDSAVVNGDTYLYRVRAYNAKGDGALSEAARITPAPVPPAPSNLRADVVETGVRLAWVEPVEPVERYLVYRAIERGGTPTLVANVTETSFVDTAVERGRTYFYTVVSRNNAGGSPPSLEAAASLVRKPGAPENVFALGLEGEIRVSWTAPADTGDAPASALKYYVTRTTSGQSRIVGTDIATNVYTDRTVTPGQTYAYTVTTLNPMASDPSASSTSSAREVENKPPESVLAALPPVTVAGAPVELDASNSADLDGSIREYLFDFGDGTDPVTTQQPTLSHAYATNGTYRATVIVTDNRGATSTASAQVIVGETVKNEPESGLPGAVTPRPSASPGSENPEVPGLGLAAILGVFALAALAFRRRR